MNVVTRSHPSQEIDYHIFRPLFLLAVVIFGDGDECPIVVVNTHVRPRCRYVTCSQYNKKFVTPKFPKLLKTCDGSCEPLLGRTHAEYSRINQQIKIGASLQHISNT